LGTNDVARAGRFYDALLGEIGAKRTAEAVDPIHWETRSGERMLGVTSPYDGKPATSGNGTMIALAVNDRETVGALHAKALELGARDEGGPGPRGTDGFYGAYCRDLDGNKLAFYVME
jgi:catechol 2,3-dioxygenase-like lactoylglutathione lyase family enzyme